MDWKSFFRKADVILLFAIAATTDGCRPREAEVKTTRFSHYLYRYVAAAYDSAAVQAVWGEMVLENTDQNVVSFRQRIGFPGLDTTMDFINRACSTNSFRIGVSTGSGTLLHVFRSILVSRHDSALRRRDLADTLSWTLEILDAANNRKIATLDSIGILPVTSGMAFPSLFGYDTTRTKLTFRFGPAYAEASAGRSAYAGVDSCYLIVKFSKRGPGAPRYQIWDLEQRAPVSKFERWEND